MVTRIVLPAVVVGGAHLTSLVFGQAPAAGGDALVAPVSAAIGSALTLFFTYLLSKQKNDVAAKLASNEQLFNESRKMRDDMRSELLDLRAELVGVQAKNINCQAENMGLKSQLEAVKADALLLHARVKELESLAAKPPVAAPVAVPAE